MKAYENNTQPKEGDEVRFVSEKPDGAIYIVKSVGLGRVGNKVSIAPKDNPDDFDREYYYYCLAPVASVPIGAC